MNSLFQPVYYDPSIYSNLEDEKCYACLIYNIKHHITENKIIYEKTPKTEFYTKKEKFTIDRNRFITENNDHILLFLTSENEDSDNVVLVWYNQYGLDKHTSIYPGKAIIINPYRAFIQSVFIQSNNSLYSAMLCDFQHYNLPKFIRQHNKNSYNLNFNYGIM